MSEASQFLSPSLIFHGRYAAPLSMGFLLGKNRRQVAITLLQGTSNPKLHNPPLQADYWAIRSHNWVFLNIDREGMSTEISIIQSRRLGGEVAHVTSPGLPLVKARTMRGGNTRS